MSEHHDIPELTPAERIRVRAMVSDMTEMAAGLRAGTAAPEDVEGAVARIMSDRDTMLNALQVPTDAGPFAAALETILRRIPDGWGRWIGHDAGWYPIVVALDRRLSAIDPEYVVHQIKEKYGTLRYYCAPSAEEPSPAVLDAFRAIIGEAERASAITCERCGEPGVLHETRYLVKTVCASCAHSLGYTPVQQDTT
ncbi:hypothetical protein [Mycolicibacterium tusciae]|uniref:Uncharacterized protein n=1 Tax=Mycolicibacterium tusciae TaxID=75922 RepID=A0A1X0JJN1_9MYCO|nr:hypothetical protein [Mycolicibacterium tusciae]ORB62780.1 hypothetical protein BST47_22570 [Mycolicibacterium tusciae]